MNPDRKDYGLKYRLCGDLGNIWLAHEVHLEVAAEHHHGVHQARLEDGVVQREQQIVGLPTKSLLRKIKVRDDLYSQTSVHTLIKDTHKRTASTKKVLFAK